MLPAAVSQGSSHDVDPRLVSRLARLHMLDTVRTLGDYYSPQHVREAALSSTVTAIAGNRVSVRFSGSVELRQTNVRMFQRTADRTSPIPKRPERSYTAKLLGKAVFDQDTQTFAEFELVAVGTKTGGSRFSPFPAVSMGVAFTLPKQPAIRPIEPRFLSQYDW